MDYVNRHKLIKYSIALVIVLTLLSIIPKVKMSFSDVLVSSLIILAIYIAIDNILYDNPCKPKDMDQQQIHTQPQAQSQAQPQVTQLKIKEQFDILSDVTNNSQRVIDVTGKVSQQATSLANSLPSNVNINSDEVKNMLSLVPTINPSEVDNPLLDIQPNPPIVNKSAITTLNDTDDANIQATRRTQQVSNIGMGMIPKIEECSTCKPNDGSGNKNTGSNILNLVNTSTTVYRPERKYETEGSRSGVMTNEMIYTDYNIKLLT